MAGKGKTGDEPITIKKYANRRLYNTATSSYVTLDDLCQMVKAGDEFVVFDAKTGEDITRPVLTQIIVEEEAKGQNLLPIGFLRQLISFYGDSLQSLVPGYLDQSMDSFTRNKDQMRGYLQNAFDGLFPFGSIEEMGKQNAAFLEQTMKMFTPSGTAAGSATAKPTPASASESESGGDAGRQGPSEGTGKEDSENFADLKHKIDALQKQLEELTEKRRD